MRTTTRHRRRAVGVGLAAGALVLTACGGGADDSDGDAAVVEAPAASAADTAASADGAATDDVTTDGDAGDDAAMGGSAPDDVDPGPAEGSLDGSGDGTAATSTQRDDGGVDLVGAEVGAASAVEPNPFPDLVVDDLNRGKQVNLRNAVPGDRPVLLWFWAPH